MPTQPTNTIACLTRDEYLTYDDGTDVRYELVNRVTLLR